MFPREVLTLRLPEQLLSFPQQSAAGLVRPSAAPARPLRLLRKDDRSPLQTTSSLGQGPSVSHGTDPAQPGGHLCCCPTLCPAPRPKCGSGLPSHCLGLVLPGGGRKCPKQSLLRMSPL